VHRPANGLASAVGLQTNTAGSAQDARAHGHEKPTIGSEVTSSPLSVKSCTCNRSTTKRLSWMDTRVERAAGKAFVRVQTRDTPLGIIVS
jgi:hypothetical protein